MYYTFFIYSRQIVDRIIKQLSNSNYIKSIMSNKDLAFKVINKIESNPKQALIKWKQTSSTLSQFMVKFVQITYEDVYDFQKCLFKGPIQNFMIGLSDMIENEQEVRNRIDQIRNQIKTGVSNISKGGSSLKSISISSLSQPSVLSSKKSDKKNKIHFEKQGDKNQQSNMKKLPQNIKIQQQEKKNIPPVQPQKKQINPNITEINGKDICVIVQYLSNKVNIDYQHNKFVLKKEIIGYVQGYFQNNLIEVQNNKASLSKISGKDYQKSKQSENYYFDPFCECIEFQVKRIDQKQFTQSCKVKDKEIVLVIFQELKEQKQSKKLNQRDDIQKLIKDICQKKQFSQKTKLQYIKKFKVQEDIKIIKDLFHWEKQNFQKLRLKTNFTYEIVQMIERIKYESGAEISQKKRKIRQQKLNCIKTANAHKILRYVVFKTKGTDQLSKLSLINVQNMTVAVEIVKKQIINDQLLNQLHEYFYQFTHVPKTGQKSVSFSRGLVLYGPPGTGKTQLTQALPELIGFHLISHGLSAADFMKSLVGESSRMILNLVNRANLSPHLLCSVAIDQVDGLVPDRKDKDEKNKGEGISMLLSVIGGIKDVPNLLYFTSTNHLKKIDQAIRRRLSGQFQVGRPNPEARKKVILDDMQFLQNDPQLLNYLIKVTSNFTGAALKRLTSVLLMKISKKRYNNYPQKLTKQQITQGSTQIAKQFSITLGMSTFPQIYSLKTNKKYIFSMKFLQKIANKLIIISQQKDSFCITYANQMQKYIQDKQQIKLKKYYQVNKDKINIQDKYNINLQSFISWLYRSLKQPIIKLCKTQQQCHNLFKKQYKQPTIAIIKQYQEIKNYYGGQMLGQIIAAKNRRDQLYLFYYRSKSISINQCYKLLGWQQNITYPYSGRILIQLNDQPRMAFQLNTPKQQQTKFSFKYFMKTQKSNSVNDILPQLIQFFTQRQVSYILLIEYQLMLQNAAYDQQKMLEIIQEKMAQAMNYNKVAVIINVDSLIVLNKSSSDSSMGRSTSYSISDQNMYRLLINYMRQFAMISKKQTKMQRRDSFTIAETRLQQQQILQIQQKQKWIAIITNNPQLADIIKKDLRWPYTPQQRQKIRKDQQKKIEKRCVRCNTRYTQEQNQNQRKCMGHPGPIIDINLKAIAQGMTIKKARGQQMKKRRNSKQNQKNQNLYIFACCYKGIDQPGESSYRHITKNQLQTQDDQLYMERKQREMEWEDAVNDL